MPTYLRDKRSPTPKSKTVSHVMSRNRAKDTKPELLLRRALWNAHLRGYRINKRISLKGSPTYEAGAPAEASSRGVDVGGVDAEASGSGFRRRGGSLPKIQNRKSKIENRGVRPDITFTTRKLAIFVHGCFWHRCPTCNYKLPKNNRTFWRNKFNANVARDSRKVADLTAAT